MLALVAVTSAATALIITGISPSSMAPSQTNYYVYVYGTGFERGA